MKIDLSWHVSGFGCPRDSLANQIVRLLELPPKPAYVAEIKWRRRGGIHAEAELGIAIARRIIYLQATREACLCIHEIALVKASQAETTVSDRHVGRPRPALGLAAKLLGSLPRQSQFATHKVAGPQSIVSGEAFGGAMDLGCEFRRTRERTPRFLGCKTTRQHHRLAIACQ